MNTITQTIKVPMTYEQPTISASWVSRLLGQLGQVDFTEAHDLWIPRACRSGVRRHTNLIQPMPKGDTIHRWDWGYSVQKDTYGKGPVTSVTVWYYRHPELSNCDAEIELIRAYLSEQHGLVVSEIEHDTETVDGFAGPYEVRKDLPRWAWVRVSKKPIVDGHPDNCLCGLHD